MALLSQQSDLSRTFFFVQCGVFRIMRRKSFCLRLLLVSMWIVESNKTYQAGQFTAHDEKTFDSQNRILLFLHCD